MMTLRTTVNKYLSALFHWYVPEMILFLVGAGLYLFNSIKYSMPTGYAGLYTLMTDLLRANAFKMPQVVPYYGPGGFPYAYPQAGFYLAALIESIFHLPGLTYLRFAPPVLTLVFLCLDYLLIRRITASRVKALLGVALTISMGAVYEYHVQAAGMVRALALVFATAALIFSWDTLFIPHSSRFPYLRALLAGVALGLTVLSHLSYALFAILSILVFLIFTPKITWLDKLKSSAMIFGVGFVVSSAWWATLLGRYGLRVLTNPSQSHGNFRMLKNLLLAGTRIPNDFIQRLFTALNDWTPGILVGLFICGLLYIILRRKWIYIVWFLVIFLLVGEAKRFLIIIACIVSAELIGSVLEYVYQQDILEKRLNFFVYLVAGLTLVFFCIYGGYRIIRSDSPTLTPSLIEISTYVQDNTPLGSSYLMLDNNNDLDEWIPYFAQRAPIIGSWGAEWTGKSDDMVYLSADLDNCISSPSYTCLQKLVDRVGIQPACLISLANRSALNDQITLNTGWQVTFKNDQFVVFTPQK
jgi:hypothetical protein